MSHVRFRVVAAVVAAAAIVPSAGAHAQTRTTGQIVGTVKDASGGVVANADLILIDLGTGLNVEKKSDTNGGFVFPNLQPGRWVTWARLMLPGPGSGSWIRLSPEHSRLQNARKWRSAQKLSMF